MKSTMSSSAEARSRMSSRSIGVTNVWFRRWMMSCVSRSPSCSQIRMSRETSFVSGKPRSIWSRRSALRTRLRAEASNRSKNSRSRGAKRFARRGMGARSYGRQPLPQRVELLRVDRVRVLRARERPAAHLIGEGGDPRDHLALEVGEALGEPRAHPVVDAEQVVEHEHLSVGGGPG